MALAAAIRSQILSYVNPYSHERMVKLKNEKKKVKETKTKALNELLKLFFRKRHFFFSYYMRFIFSKFGAE